MKKSKQNPQFNFPLNLIYKKKYFVININLSKEFKFKAKAKETLHNEVNHLL